MLKLKNIGFAGVFVICSIQLMAQSMVSSTAYNWMLKSMLSHSVPECSAKQAADFPKPLFLDARATREFEVSHIGGAKWVGYDDFAIASLKSFPKDTLVVVYCSVGYRSEKIAEKIKAAGFTNVFNMYGGIFEWVNEEYPVRNAKGVTKQVHAYSKTFGVWLNKGEKVYE